MLNSSFQVEAEESHIELFLNITIQLPDIQFGCVSSEEEIPVPISNTEVKLFCGDGTALLRVGE